MQNGTQHVNANQDVTEKQQDVRSRPLHATSREVRQVASIKNILTSFKKDPEYIMVEIPKRPDGKYTNRFFASVTKIHEASYVAKYSSRITAKGSCF